MHTGQSASQTATLNRDFTRRSLQMLLATAVVAMAATLSQSAMARSGADHGADAGSHGGRHGMRGGPGMDGGPMGMLSHPKMAERVLDSVNATPEQRTQIRQLTDAARTEMSAQRESGKAMREQAAKLFAQPTVDARAAETLRLQMLAQHDQASKRMTQLMLDVSRVLTPEQRAQLAARMEQRRSMMQRHHHEQQQLGK